MIRLISKVLLGIDKISENTGKIFSLLILVIILLEAGESVLRFLGKPTDWSWELASMLFGAFFMMGGAWVLKDNNHVRTDVFYNMLSRKWKAYFDLFFFTTIFFTFTIVMIWKMGTNAIYSVSIREETYSMWAPPLYPLKVTFLIAYILLFMQGLAKWTRDLIYVIRGIEI